jgi:iron(III) transport system substrate-binding protein
MSIRNQLRITDPEDRLTIYDLDEVKVVTSLGQDESNDIVLTGAGVAPMQLVLHYRQPPYRLTISDQAEPVTVNGKAVRPGRSCEIHDRDEIRVGGYALTFRVYTDEPVVPDEVPPSPPSPEPGPPPLPDEVPPSPPSPEPGPPPPPEEPVIPEAEPTEPAILTSLTQEAWTVDVEQTVTLQLSVINAGDLVADFDVTAEGVPQEWVTISPAEFNLNEREGETVDVSITPPRLPTSRAGPHLLTLVVTSPIYPGERSQASATITITPYYELAVGNLSPKRQSIAWSQPAGQAEVPLTNKGNSEVVVVLAGEDDARACRFEFEIPDELEGALYLTKEVDLQLPVDGTVRLPVELIPQNRPLIGAGGRLVDLRPRVHPYTITVTTAQGQQRPWTLAGEWETTPRFSRRVLLVSALALILLLLVSFLPGITDYRLSATPDSIRAGQIVELDWKARPLISFKLNGQSIEPPVTLRPEQTTTYQLRAETWLSRLLPFLAADDETRVGVRPVKPDILLFEASPERVTPGETVVLSWVVDDADEVVLIDHAAELQETLASPSGSREIQVGQEPVRYTLRAVAADGSVVERAVGVEVGSPVIRVFSVKPAAITSPTDVELSWLVRGAADKITLSRRSFDKSSGRFEVVTSTVAPYADGWKKNVTNTTVFSLSVSSGARQVVETARVKVLKPTPISPVALLAAQAPTPIPAGTRARGSTIAYTALSERELEALGAATTISMIEVLDKLEKKTLTLSRNDLTEIAKTNTVTLTRILGSFSGSKLTLKDLGQFDYAHVVTPTDALAIHVLIVRKSTLDLVRQLVAEKENPRADVIWGVAATGMIRLRAEGLLEPLVGLNQPPGLENIQAGWLDPTAPPQWLGLSAWPAVFCMNEDKLRTLDGEPPPPESWHDLTKPIYHNRIVMPSPYSSGTGYMVVSGLLQMDPFGEPAGWAYLDRLHENIAWYTPSGSEPCDLAADDRYPGIAIGISAASDCPSDEQVSKLATGYVFPEEGYGWEMDAVALARKDEISEEALAFVAWAISDEAMQEYAKFRPVVSYGGFESTPTCFRGFDRAKMIPNRLLWASANYERITQEWLSRYAAEPALIQVEPVR